MGRSGGGRAESGGAGSARSLGAAGGSRRHEELEDGEGPRGPRRGVAPIRVTIAFLLMGAVPTFAVPAAAAPLSAAPTARAPSPETVTPLPASYVVDRFTTEQGLPSNSVVGITEAPDGYLWLATLGGLARFDGRRFTIFHSGNSPGLASNRFRSVKSDPEGDLWAVGQAGEVFRRHDGAFRMVARAGPLTYIQIDSKGAVWCLSRDDSERTSSIVRLEGETLGAQRIPAARRTWLLPRSEPSASRRRGGPGCCRTATEDSGTRASRARSSPWRRPPAMPP